MVGNHVRALETWFGTPLLLRTTRQQSLTDKGQEVLSHARSLLAGMTALEAVAEQASDLTGFLRISAPIGIGRHHLAPAARAFARLHPRLQIETRLSDAVEDMVKAGLDLAIRNGPLLGNEATLVARVVARQRLILAASPEYLAKWGTPQSLDDLNRHESIRYCRNGRPRSWLFPTNGQILQMDPPTSFMADNIETLRDAALDGAGIAWLPDWLLAPSIRDGSLGQLLPHQQPFIVDVYLIMPASKAVSPKLMLAGRYLADALSRSMQVS